MRVSALVAVAILLTAADGPQKRSQDEIDASVERIMELQKQRIAVLQDAAEMSLHLAQNARLDSSEALDDQMVLLEAKLDAAKTDPERVLLYKEAVEWLKGLEELAKAQKMAARATELPRLRMQAQRLELEVQLERVKIKEAK